MIPFDRPQFTKLLKEAHIKPRLARTIRFAPENIENWADRDFLPVTTKSGNEGVLIVSENATLRAIIFSIAPLAASSAGIRKPIICDICHTWRRGTEAARITLPRDDGSSVSYLCCGDLLCSLHVRDKTPAAALSRTQLRENISLEGRVERLRRQLHAIVA